MTRAAFLVAVLALAPTLPEGCAKALGKGKTSQASASADASSASVPVATATTTTPTSTAIATAPPVWAPPDTRVPLPAPPPPTPSVSPDAAKARALADAGEHKKVRALLEKKVKAGKGTDDEAAVLMESCVALRDKACIDTVKAKHRAVE